MSFVGKEECVVHPLVLLSVVDHYNRVAKGTSHTHTTLSHTPPVSSRLWCASFIVHPSGLARLIKKPDTQTHRQHHTPGHAHVVFQP
jgi:hypothetical protein